MRISEKRASELTKLSRVTIQRFRDIPGGTKLLCPIIEEKDGLYGKVTYYYYDEVEMEKLWLIRLFKSLGKSKNEIIDEMTNGNFNKKIFLENTINELSTLIEVAKNYLNTDIGYEVLAINNSCDEFDFDDINEIVNSTSKILNEIITSFMNDQKYHDTIDPNQTLIRFYDDIFTFIEENVLPQDKLVQGCIESFLLNYFDYQYYLESFLNLILYTIKKMSEENSKYVEMHYFLTKAFLKYEKTKYKNDNLIILDIDNTWENMLKYAKDNSDAIQDEVEKYVLSMYYLYMKSWPLTLDSLTELCKWLNNSEYNSKSNQDILKIISDEIKLFIQTKKEELYNE